MSKPTPTERAALVKLAAGLPKGDATRRAVLTGLKQAVSPGNWVSQGNQTWVLKLAVDELVNATGWVAQVAPGKWEYTVLMTVAGLGTLKKKGVSDNGEACSMEATYEIQRAVMDAVKILNRQLSKADSLLRKMEEIKNVPFLG